MKIQLESERLYLRPWRIEDAEDMFHTWASDPEVTKYLTWNPHKDIEVTKAILELWIKQYEKPERLNFALERKEDNKLIGGIDVVGYIDNVPVIGYNLGKAYWGHGYMTEACKCLLSHLSRLGYKEAKIDACVDNLASNRVIEKVGGVLIGKDMEERPLKHDVMQVNRYIVKLG
ncbi:MAG: GNAT family N-acetyltransferase [Bacilli bacterium]|nr:GNAT family N-acetyltransferase [Bacilli bacterium]